MHTYFIHKVFVLKIAVSFIVMKAQSQAAVSSLPVGLDMSV